MFFEGFGPSFWLALGALGRRSDSLGAHFGHTRIIPWSAVPPIADLMALNVGDRLAHYCLWGLAAILLNS